MPGRGLFADYGGEESDLACGQMKLSAREFNWTAYVESWPGNGSLTLATPGCDSYAEPVLVCKEKPPLASLHCSLHSELPASFCHPEPLAARGN